MTNIKNLSVLIVDADIQFREQLVNFLLLEGYRKVEVTENVAGALEKIRKSPPRAVLLDASTASAKPVDFAACIARINKNITLILMINPGDESDWNETDVNTGCQFMIKTDFQQSLLFLLESI
jgi:DNA-binding NtrC family response regulator